MDDSQNVLMEGEKQLLGPKIKRPVGNSAKNRSLLVQGAPVWLPNVPRSTRETGATPADRSPVAQPAERPTLNREVDGANPSGAATHRRAQRAAFTRR